MGLAGVGEEWAYLWGPGVGEVWWRAPGAPAYSSWQDLGLRGAQGSTLWLPYPVPFQGRGSSFFQILGLG